MKEGIRIAAFACGPINRKGKAKSLIVGVVYRQGIVEGILSSVIYVDGKDSTAKIIKMVTKSRFHDQVRAIALNGVSMAGLNVVDVKRLKEATKAEIIIVTKRKQDHRALMHALGTLKDTQDKISMVSSQAKLRQIHIGNLFVRSTMTESDAKAFAQDSYAAIRLAHMVASGISTGESNTHI